MPVRTYKDSQGRKRYSVEFEQRGHRVFRRLPAGATKEQAQQLETRLKHELIDQTVLGKRPNVGLDFAIRSWLLEMVAGRKSETQTVSHANAVLAATEGRSIGDIAECAHDLRNEIPIGERRDGAIGTQAPGGRGESAKGIRSLEGHKAHPGLSSGTINRRLCILKATAKFAWRKGWTEENLSSRIQLLPEPKYQRREITLEMARSLIDNAPNARAKALIALSAYTGLRLGEVLKLTPEDVRGGVIVARDTKNGTDRLIPILPELEPHLSQLPFKAGWRNVYRGFESARRRSGIQIRYHDLRHMVASALASSEAHQGLSMKLMGHRSVATHQRYVHPEIGAMRRVLRKALPPISLPIKKKKAAKKAA